MRGKVFTLASVALLSCRAVLGIEDLEEHKDGGTGSDGGSSTDGGKDAGPDTTPAKDSGGDAPSACAAMPGPDCGKCCRDNNKEANKTLEDTLRDGGGAGCLCGASCPTECGSNLCAGSMAGGTDCPKCIDTVIKGGKCSPDVSACEKSADCKVLTDCIRSCP